MCNIHIQRIYSVHMQCILYTQLYTQSVYAKETCDFKEHTKRSHPTWALNIFSVFINWVYTICIISAYAVYGNQRGPLLVVGLVLFVVVGFALLSVLHCCIVFCTFGELAHTDLSQFEVNLFLCKHNRARTNKHTCKHTHPHTPTLTRPHSHTHTHTPHTLTRTRAHTHTRINACTSSTHREWHRHALQQLAMTAVAAPVAATAVRAEHC